MANNNNFFERTVLFVRSLEHPYRWAKEKGIQPWLVSRLRNRRIKTITVDDAAALIEAADGELTWEDRQAKING